MYSLNCSVLFFPKGRFFLGLRKVPKCDLSSKYFFAASITWMLSLSSPIPALHFLHNSPLTLFVLWLWSMTMLLRLRGVPQISHLPAQEDKRPMNSFMVVLNLLSFRERSKSQTLLYLALQVLQSFLPGAFSEISFSSPHFIHTKRLFSGSIGRDVAETPPIFWHCH